MAQAFRVVAIGKATDALIQIFKEKYPEIMEGAYANELIKDSNAWNLIDACKKIGKKYVYVSRQNLSLELMGRKVIHDLMDIFVEGVLEDEENSRFAKKIYALMSSNYRTVYDDAIGKNSLPEFYCQMQLVTDYICGMTDTFACQLHRKLTNG
jgi:dGTPase